MAGKTMLVDLHGCNPGRLADVSRLISLLSDLPAIIRMTPITAPQIAEVKPPQVPRDEWGHSGNVLFIESHLYFHCWPEHRKMWVDVTSCKDFDPVVVGQYLKERFGAKEVVYRVAERDVRGASQCHQQMGA